jgi:hypothetical protein
MRHPNEKHRLTRLQRQLLKWLKMEGGGCLRTDQLFGIVVRNAESGTMYEALGERMYEAVDSLIRMKYTEVRIETGAKKREDLSLYDFGAIVDNTQEDENGFHWKKGECPVVALTDSGTIYSDQL